MIYRVISFLFHTVSILFLPPQVFATMGMTDPHSQQRVRPQYSEELLAWRAKLRPFLCPDGSVSTSRPLESLSPGVTMVQTAVDLTSAGQSRCHELCALFANGSHPAHRPSVPPHFLTLEEKLHYEDDGRRSITSLKGEFLELLCRLGDQQVATSLCEAMNAAITHAHVLQCTREMRDLVAASTDDV